MGKGLICLKHRIYGFALLALSLLLTVGTAILFPTCGPAENGAWMKCHWSGQAVIGAGIVLSALAAAYLLIPQNLIRLGFSIAAIPAGLFILAIPNGLIGLCGKSGMQCRAVTQPAVTVLSIAVVIFSVVNILFLLKTAQGEGVNQT